ncbi:MAG: acetyl-CoA carboxylase biotin carboxyl carrier protein subunit [Pseudomonadales bacterium]|nr:acetyl-CoA carboxylase biotin carboxyl carrier protein subunit [Pseudomonadales bacterium]
MARVEIPSEVAGTVWKRVAEPDALLEAGAVILILESMKMEIPVEAPCAGRLLELCVAEGDPVAEDQVVAVLDSDRAGTS